MERAEQRGALDAIEANVRRFPVARSTRRRLEPRALDLEVVNLQKGEQRRPDILRLNPNGNEPVLEDRWVDNVLGAKTAADVLA